MKIIKFISIYIEILKISMEKCARNAGLRLYLSLMRLDSNGGKMNRKWGYVWIKHNYVCKRGCQLGQCHHLFTSNSLLRPGVKLFPLYYFSEGSIAGVTTMYFISL